MRRELQRRIRDADSSRPGAHHRRLRFVGVGVAGVGQPRVIALEDRQDHVQHVAGHLLEISRRLRGLVDPIHAGEVVQRFQPLLFEALALDTGAQHHDAERHVPREFIQQACFVRREGMGLAGVEDEDAERALIVVLEGQGDDGTKAAAQGAVAPGRGLGVGGDVLDAYRALAAHGGSFRAAAEALVGPGERYPVEKRVFDTAPGNRTDRAGRIVLAISDPGHPIPGFVADDAADVVEQGLFVLCTQQRLVAGAQRAQFAVQPPLRLLGELALLAVAQGHDADGQVACQFVEDGDFLRVEVVDAAGMDGQHSEGLAFALQRQGDHGSVAALDGLLAPACAVRVMEDVARDARPTRADRGPARAAAIFAVFRPAHGRGADESGVEAAVGHGPPRPGLVLLGEGDHREAIAAFVDGDAAHLLQQGLFVDRLDQRPVGAAQYPKGTVRPREFEIGLRWAPAAGSRGRTGSFRHDFSVARWSAHACPCN